MFENCELINDLLRRAGSHDKTVALEAQREIALAVEKPAEYALMQGLPNHHVPEGGGIKGGAQFDETTSMSADTDIKYCREARWDIVRRMIELLNSAMVEKMKNKTDGKPFILGGVQVTVDPSAHATRRFRLRITVHYSEIGV